MKLQCGNVYGRTAKELHDEVKKKLDCFGIDARSEAIKVIVSAFQHGMNRGLSGAPSDDGVAEDTYYMARAWPHTGEFKLYEKVL